MLIRLCLPRADCISAPTKLCQNLATNNLVPIERYVIRQFGSISVARLHVRSSDLNSRVHPYPAWWKSSCLQSNVYPITPDFSTRRLLHTTNNILAAAQENKQQQIAKSRPQTEISTARKVVETGRDISYLGIVIFGLIITGGLFYMIGHELFSSQTPYGVFSTALKSCQRHPQVQDELGDPIKGHGERDSRGRSRHVNHVLFEKDGIEFMRMQFYLKGSLRAGQAHLEVFKGESGGWETRYLFVETESYPRKVIVIEDNR